MSMAQSKQEILALLEQAGGMRPRHRFGQNFMIDQNLVRLIANTAHLQRGDLVIEVGPGTGTLTEELIARGANVVAVEIDRNLAALLRSRMEGRESFALIEGDALDTKHSLNEKLAEHIFAAHAEARVTKLVANLPYNIASPLIINLLLAGVELLTFTVQKEVADRLRARAGLEAYGALTVMAQMLAHVEVLRTLPPQAFWPAPKIESALVRLTRQEFPATIARPFGIFVQQLFSARRKTLRRALIQFDYPADSALSALGLNPQQRPESLAPQQFLDLFRLVKRPAV